MAARLGLVWLAVGLLACSSTAAISSGSGGASSSSTSGGGGATSDGGFGGDSTTSSSTVTSSSSSASSGGGGAMPCPMYTPSLPDCDPATCNNGVIDACLASSEACDGANLNGASCTSLGFSGGTLDCQSHCAFDTSNCQRCEPTGGPLLSCGSVPVNALRPRSLDIASAGSELAMAWVSLAEDGSAELRFARFSDTLMLLNEAGPLPATCPERVAIHAVGNHWLLAIESQSGIELLAIDDDGTVLASELLSLNGHKPDITEGPANNSLVTWFFQGGAYAALVSDMAAPLSFNVPLPFGTDLDQSGEHLTSAFIGGNYLLATSDSPYIVFTLMDPTGILDGINLLFYAQTDAPQLVQDGVDGWLTYYDYSGGSNTVGPHLIEVAYPKGFGPEVELGASPQYGSPTPLTLLNGNPVMLLAGSGPNDSVGALDLFSVDPQGTPLITPARVVTDPMGMRDVRLETLGNTVVAAWITGSPPTLGFAQLQP